MKKYKFLLINYYKLKLRSNSFFVFWFVEIDNKFSSFFIK